MLQLMGKHIFMVEDNLANKTIQVMLLEQAGAQTTIERWGNETIPKLRKAMPVDLIILDLMLPNQITGFDIFKEIRSYEEFSHIPIVAVSASNPSEAIPLTRDSGFDGFISKPVDFDKFPEQIGKIIMGQKIFSS